MITLDFSGARVWVDDIEITDCIAGIAVTPIERARRCRMHTAYSRRVRARRRRR